MRALFRELPLSDLIFRAQTVHREFFDASAVQMSTLLSIKTGGCPRTAPIVRRALIYDTGVDAEKLMPLDKVLAARAPRTMLAPAALHGRRLALAEGSRSRPGFAG